MPASIVAATSRHGCSVIGRPGPTSNTSPGSGMSPSSSRPATASSRMSPARTCEAGSSSSSSSGRPQRHRPVVKSIVGCSPPSVGEARPAPLTRHSQRSCGSASGARKPLSSTLRGRKCPVTASRMPGESPIAPAISATSRKYASCGSSLGSSACIRTTHLQRFTESSTSSPSSDCASSAQTSAGTGRPSIEKVKAQSVPSSFSSGLSPSSSWPSQAAKAVPISSRVGASACGQKTTQPEGLGSGSSQGSSLEALVSGSDSGAGSLMQRDVRHRGPHLMGFCAGHEIGELGSIRASVLPARGSGLRCRRVQDFTHRGTRAPTQGGLDRASAPAPHATAGSCSCAREAKVSLGSLFTLSRRP